MRRAAAAAVALAAAVLLLSACRVEVGAHIGVTPGGSGRVEVGVGLDEEAVERVGDLEDDVRTDDLAERGWEITGPRREGDLTWLRATKPFQSPGEAEAIMRDISGPDGPFRDFRLERERSFLRTRYRFSGTVDLSPGIEGFGDQALRQRLGGTSIGHGVEEIERLARQTLDRVFRFRVAVRLPGDVRSNAPTDLSGGAAWRPVLGERAVLRADSEAWNGDTIAWSAVAIVAAVALVGILGGRALVARRGQARTRQAPETTR